MNTHSSLGPAATLQLHANGVVPAGTTTTEAFVLMTCEACDLAGGPFPPAEAAYLQAIHNRVHHGYITAA
jgi:hypothetical protein